MAQQTPGVPRIFRPRLPAAARLALLAALSATGGCTGSADAGPPDAALEEQPPESNESGIGGECGDGRINGREICDDGATAAGDGCDAECLVEPGFFCGGAPSECHLLGQGDAGPGDGG